ncbi:TetR/AcrR family transcriptional regulator [Roseivivax marinus]|uniref:TetR/AcrR family transcriptional regulator n=1 Tax=Roseivivax marinus TaxID=1379903 RepID=UPI0008C6F474|nr:TetR/AcrR family transcriptional regulator [Roseivivax marinus]UMA65899.1 TetR/AcrR family transcriptional regulator [Roseivivax marinus]SEL12518.1 transcriptional regulator, TetR family [Roseivivax marinus]
MARPRARDFEEKRHILLVEAAQVFATQGMERASMSQIAAAAGVSKSLLYHYYPSKDALIFAIIATHLEALDAALEEADDPLLEPRARLRRLVGTVLESYRGADDFHKVQLNAADALPEAERAAIRTLERRIVRRVSAVFVTLRPDLASGEPALLMPVTMSLFGMLNWVYMWFRDDGALTREAYAEIATGLMLDGVAGLK